MMQRDSETVPGSFAPSRSSRTAAALALHAATIWCLGCATPVQRGNQADAAPVMQAPDAARAMATVAIDASTKPPQQPAPDAAVARPGAGTPSAAPGRGGPGVAGNAAAGNAATMPDGVTESMDAGSQADSGASDRCDVAKLDPAHLPATRALSGSLATHDPTVIESKGVYYLWNTGPRLPAKMSTDFTRWTDAPAAFGSTNPAWVAKEVPKATDLWAPDVSFFGGQFHLYYSASAWSTNSSCIGHATRPALETGSWADHGPVVCSNHGTRDDWNAIDPNLVVDAEGKAWLSFGSFWSGIKAIELDASGARANDKLYALASRNGGAIEAPFIVRRCGYYYLFVSFDKCCVGADSTYNIRVGRSERVMGPYVDAQGKAMMQGGGTLLLGGDSRYHGPGHNAVLFSGDKAFNVYHTYDTQQNGRAILRVSELWWNDAGWPVSGGP